MGKQVCFFMNHDDDTDFVHFIGSDNVQFIDNKNIVLNANEVIDRSPLIFASDSNKNALIQFFLVYPKSKIILGKNGFVDATCSDVIEVWRSCIKNENQIWNGRIWFETKFYNSKKDLESKDKWLEKEFATYKKWIVNKYRTDSKKSFYIGEGALDLYEHKGYQMMNAPRVAIEF